MLIFLKQSIKGYFPWVVELARRAMKIFSIRYCYHRRTDSLDYIAAHSKGEEEGVGDAKLIDRLVASYSLRTEVPSGQWSNIFLDRHRDIHDAMMGNDRTRIEEILRKPATSDLMYGFENNTRSLHSSRRIEDAHAPALTLDALICLAEAIAARPIDNPENYTWRASKTRADEVISQIESQLKFQLLLPNLFPAEYGIVCSRGIMSYRVPQAIYQAWRISQLVSGISNPKVLEIGGGLGRTALYARQFGITDYTIIDIPVSSLAQGYFLGRVLGDEAVSLYGESAAPRRVDSDRVKLLPPSSFLEGSDSGYDLVVNVDSLTELGSVAACRYWSAIQKRANVFLSINHEANDFSVATLITESGGIAQKTRVPYWMRRGYVEEVCSFVH